MLELFGRKKSFFERWLDRLEDKAEQAAESLERGSEKAVETAEVLRRKAGSRLRDARDEAVSRAQSSREAIAEHAEAIARRAEELRRSYSRRVEEKRVLEEEKRARRRERARIEEPLTVDIRDADRVTLRGRRDMDIRTPDGELIRYRYYERPGLRTRLYLRTRGRRVWPPG